MSPSCECIVVPRQVLDILLTAPNIQLNHPSSHQLKTVVKRYLYALDIDKVIANISDGCHSCVALRQTPTVCVKQSTSSPPNSVCQSFAADVIKGSRQLILVLQETVTPYTSSQLLQDERHQTLRDALIQLCIQMRPMGGHNNLNGSKALVNLVNDKSLHQHRITRAGTRQKPQQESCCRKGHSRTRV